MPIPIPARSRVEKLFVSCAASETSETSETPVFSSPVEVVSSGSLMSMSISNGEFSWLVVASDAAPVVVEVRSACAVSCIAGVSSELLS